MKKDLVFIASGGRTGTTFFGEAMKDAIDDCWSEHTPDMVLGLSSLTMSRIRRFGIWHMVIGRLLGVTGVRTIGHRLLTGAISEEECIRRLRQARLRYHAEIQERLIVESYSRYWMVATRLHRIWPGAKLIGIIRDPRDWVESWRRHQPRRHTRQFFGWFPLGPLTPGAVGDLEWADRWDDLDQFGRLAWDWRIIYGQLDRAAESPHARLFRFEDLFGSDEHAVRELVAFAADHGERQYRVRDLSGFTDNVRNASKGPRRDWPDWSVEDARLLDALCGPLMRKYGYGLEPEWRAKLGTDSDAAGASADEARNVDT